MATNQKYIPALKFHWLTKIYDWLIGTFMPEKAFKAALLHNAEIKIITKFWTLVLEQPLYL